jgi:hypothetical protein
MRAYNETTRKEEDMAPNNDNNGNGGSWKDYVSYVVAILALVFFVWFIYYMLGLKASPEGEWTRSVYLFAGVEAIAFAAAGFLFGREVNRQQAENSEINAQRAANGRALAEVIRTKRDSSPGGEDGGGGGFGALGPEEAAQVWHRDIDELANLADRLFPG